MRSREPRFRWWWPAGLAWLVLYVAIMAPLWGAAGFRRWMWSHPRSLLVTLGTFLVGVAWLVVVAPLLDSGVARFSERRPARRRARVATLFAWTPTVIFALLLFQATLVRALDIQDFGWFDHGYVAWSVGAFALSLFYGRMMSRHLRRRLRAAAARAGRCYACNYDLAYGTGDRCPECGFSG